MFQTLQAGLERSKVIPAGDGDPISMLGIEMIPKLTAEDTHGAFSLIEQHVAPFAGSPPHVCHREDKTVMVLEGQFEMLLGESIQQVGPGAIVYVPRGALHHFRNNGASAGRLMVAVSPGGHERFLRDLSDVMNGIAPDPMHIADVCRAHAIEMLI